MKKILISAANGTIMPELVTYLKKFYYVTGIDSNDKGFANEYCNKFYKSPKGSDKKFISFIDKIGSKSDLIFLFVDEEIKNVTNNFHKLKYIKKKLVISPKKTINICNNKLKLHKFFSQFKEINLPSTKKLGKNIVKPKFGRGSKNIFITSNLNILKSIKKDRNFIVQEYINGKEYTVDSLFDLKGNLIFSLTRERLIAQNVSIMGKIIKDVQIDKVIRFISSKLKFCGPINVQFIKKGKKLYLIEINPRLSGSIFFSMKAGFNPIKLLITSKILRDKNIIKFNKLFIRYYKTKVV